MARLDLDYLIIYENHGTPIYSRCFANLCKVSMQDDVLFSAFLSTLTTFATVSEDTQLDEIELEGTNIDINYDQDHKINSLLMEDMRLIFFYTQFDDITIAAGFDADQYETVNNEEIIEFLHKVETVVKDNEDVDWGNVSTNRLTQFEGQLLREAIHPFFVNHDTKDRCPFGDNCPMRLAMYEEKGTITQILERITEKYRNMNMLKKIWRMMTGSPYSVPNEV